MTVRRLQVLAVKYWILCKVLWWMARHPHASAKDVERQWMIHLLHYVSRRMRPLHNLVLNPPARKWFTLNVRG